MITKNITNGVCHRIGGLAHSAQHRTNQKV